jgi:hypothetical protein
MSSVKGNQPKFIKKQFDEFKDVTTSTHLKRIASGGFSGGGTVNQYSFRLRHVKSKGTEFLGLDCQFESEDWMFLERGELIFNCDQDNYSVNFSESSKETKQVNDSIYCVETGLYVLTQELLKKISTTNELKIRIAGKSKYEEPNKKWCAKFRDYCLQFYHDVYDSEIAHGAPALASNKVFGEKPVGSKGFKVIMYFFAALFLAVIAVLFYATFFIQDSEKNKASEKSAAVPTILQDPAPGSKSYSRIRNSEVI